MVDTSFGGQWTQQKLDILRQYLDSYTTALKNQRFQLIYVDAFAGEGYWQPGSDYPSEDYDEFREVLKGSAAIALEIGDKPFDRLVFIEKAAERARSLRELAFQHHDRDIQPIKGDANTELPRFCSGMDDFDRAVVFLDPFATEVSWATVEAIAATEKIDCWILFPLMAVTRMMPTRNAPTDASTVRLDRIFGGRSHWQESYQESPQLSMFDTEPRLERPRGSEQFADMYRQRLESVFHSVAPTRRTLINSRRSPLFELFFAASNPLGAPTAVRIADHILKNW